MRIVLSSAAIGAVLALTALGANALPISPVNPSDQASALIEVRGGCGQGWHRGPLGGCRPNFWRHYAWGNPHCFVRPNGRRVCNW